MMGGGMGASMGIPLVSLGGVSSVEARALPRCVLRAKGLFWFSPPPSSSASDGATATDPERWVLQGVRDTYVLTRARAPQGHLGNRLVVIGRGLDWRELAADFSACCVGTASHGDEKTATTTSK